MDSSMSYLVLLMAISCAAALTPSECRNASDHCLAEFMENVQQPGSVSSICAGARKSLVCVQNLVCESEMNLRIAIRTTSRRLHDNKIQSCELGTYFPKDTGYPRDCQQKRESCMTAYIDNLLYHTADASNHTGHAVTLCQYLNTFASCKLKPDSCQLKKEEVEKEVREEKLRLTLPDCTVQALNKGTLNILSQMLWLSTLLTLALAAN